MRKRYLLAGLSGLAGAAVAYKLLSRERETSWEKHSDALPFTERSGFAEVDGVRVHFQEFGDENAPPVMMIHGYSSSTFTWSGVAPPIAARGFRVFVVDLIGFGFSDKPADFDYTFDSQARIITGLMNHLGIERATLVGSSYGGGVALAAALDAPEKVAGLILVSAVFNDEIINLPFTKLVKVPLLGATFTPFLTASKFYIRARMRNSMSAANHHLINDERVNGVMRPLQSASAHKALLMSLRNWNAARIERSVHRLKIPTLLVWGENDRVVPLHNAHKLHRLITDSKLIIFKNCGHIPHEEAAADFLQVVTDFLKV